MTHKGKRRKLKLKIIVLIKQTPDTEAKIQLSSDQSRLELDAVKWIINPYDEFAIEEALKIKEKQGSGEVIIASFGSDKAKELIIKGLAMGGDRGILISSEDLLTKLDALSVTKILCKVIESEKPDLVLCGKQAIDDDNMHIMGMVAEKLKWPHVNVITKLEIKDAGTVIVEREVEGGQVEVYEVKTPCVLGAHKSLNTPRFASLPGIMKAKKKPFDVKSIQDLGLSQDDLLKTLQTTCLGYVNPPQKAKGKVFKGESIDMMVEKLVKALREEAKVI